MSKTPPKQVIDEECSEVNQIKEKDGVTAGECKKRRGCTKSCSPITKSFFLNNAFKDFLLLPMSWIN